MGRMTFIPAWMMFSTRNILNEMQTRVCGAEHCDGEVGWEGDRLYLLHGTVMRIKQEMSMYY